MKSRLMRQIRSALGLPMVLICAMCLGSCGTASGTKESGDAIQDGRADVRGEVAASDVSEVGAEEAGPDQDGRWEPGISRLRADGTRIVDEEGNEVRLRGVNLGAWMFHETWISQVGYTTSGRAYALGSAKGVLEAVKAAAALVGPEYGEDTAVVTVCPGDGEAWLAEFAAALEGQLGTAEAQAFVEELRTLPTQCDDSDRKLRLTLADRFGTEKRDELLDDFRKAWISESDIEWLAQQGFTVVRVPIGYRSLMVGEDSDAPDSLQWNETALTRLDDLLAWCGKHGVWAVLDIQEAPGGQNTYGADAGLYTNPKMQDLTVEMWEVLSDRYKDNNAVAAYSLLAEPYGAPDEATRDAMYDRLVKAVRAKGDDHLCILHDGFMGMEGMPNPADFGWTNVVYSTHLFEWNAHSATAYDLLLQFYTASFEAAQNKQKVPYYIGSFSTIYNEPWAFEAARKLVAWYEQEGWSWSLWTYKRMENFASKELFNFGTSWGLRSVFSGEFRQPDPDLDSFEELKTALGSYSSVVLAPIPELLDSLTSFQ